MILFLESFGSFMPWKQYLEFQLDANLSGKANIQERAEE